LSKPGAYSTRRIIEGPHFGPLFTRGNELQLSILVLNLVYAALGVVLMYLSYRLIDRLTPEVDFPAELKRGNIAVAIFIAALFVSIALIVGRAIG